MVRFTDAVNLAKVRLLFSFVAAFRPPPGDEWWAIRQRECILIFTLRCSAKQRTGKKLMQRREHV